MVCPFCHHKNHLEIDMHSDGYSRDIIECTECGALLILKETTFDIIHGPTKQLPEEVV